MRARNSRAFFSLIMCSERAAPHSASGFNEAFLLLLRPPISLYLACSSRSLHTMSSPITISDLTFLHPTSLASLLSNPTTASSVAIIDVRDSDHIGGHVKGSSWIPVAQLDARIPELLRLHRDKEKVVFHCMLSQQKGPQSALKYARAMQAREAKEAKMREKEGASEGSAEGRKGPDVCVLEGGFGAWQSRYGDDEKLTDGYVKGLWE